MLNKLAADVSTPAGTLFERLMEDGYLILRDALSEDAFRGFCDDLDPQFAAAPFGRGLFYGETTKRFGRVLARSRHAEAFVLNELVLSLVRHALGEAGGL